MFARALALTRLAPRSILECRSDDCSADRCAAHLWKLGGRRMGADQALFLLNQLLWVAVLVSAPILGATLIIGLIVSVLQVATQIQEVTLSYVPKLLAAAALIILLGPWMLGRLTQFAISIYQSIPSLGR